MFELYVFRNVIWLNFPSGDVLCLTNNEHVSVGTTYKAAEIPLNWRDLFRKFSI